MSGSGVFEIAKRTQKVVSLSEAQVAQPLDPEELLGVATVAPTDSACAVYRGRGFPITSTSPSCVNSGSP